MINKQEIWIAMILSVYAKKLELSISESIEQLRSNGGLRYLEDYYETLHTLSNEDVVNELIEMANSSNIGVTQ